MFQSAKGENSSKLGQPRLMLPLEARSSKTLLRYPFYFSTESKKKVYYQTLQLTNCVSRLCSPGRAYHEEKKFDIDVLNLTVET